MDDVGTGFGATGRIAATASPRVQDFEHFFDVNRNRLVKALSMTLGDSELAADAVDEAMTRAVQRWSTVGAYARPEGWVYRVAFNWATSRFRRRRRDREYAPKIAAPAATFDHDFDPDLQDALATLSDAHRSVLVLRFFYDWDVQTTADALDISAGTVKSRTSRALELMAARLADPADPDEKEVER